MDSIKGTKKQKISFANLQEKDNELVLIANAFNAMQNSSSIEEALDKTQLACEYISQIMESDGRDLTHAKRMALPYFLGCSNQSIYGL